MHVTVALTDAVKPRVNRFIVEFDRVIGRRIELIAVEVLYNATLPPSSDRLLTTLTTSEDLNVYHVMLLCLQLGVEISS